MWRQGVAGRAGQEGAIANVYLDKDGCPLFADRTLETKLYPFALKFIDPPNPEEDEP